MPPKTPTNKKGKAPKTPSPDDLHRVLVMRNNLALGRADDDLEAARAKKPGYKKTEKREETIGDDVCRWADCGKTFSGADAAKDLYDHLIHDHVKEDQTECMWATCPAGVFPTAGKLVEHALWHVPDFRPFVCGTCEAAFQRAKDLTTHKEGLNHI